ncbi:hypothetical protein M404DRAFT_1001173 [Pisolithus tinctorius Marx 270]|uniref:Uncharacterized protein n=1 Tax=Pisolithus tinctorius Marx 270 TaxID=870435 RepID=A0A0C3J3N7_PISTI|nr:hypothetical protein M404DRAFT_1001173 [Pisolithus tinctorius Marx 270]
MNKCPDIIAIVIVYSHKAGCITRSPGKSMCSVTADQVPLIGAAVPVRQTYKSKYRNYNGTNNGRVVI